MNKKLLILIPLVVCALAGCASGGNADTGDNGIVQMPSKNASAGSNSTLPPEARAKIPAPTK